MERAPIPPRPIRVMIVDDSPTSRAAVEQIVRAAEQVEVILSTPDADEALRRALVDPPDVICLDLQMPRMDGFTFLRLLMARRPTPVIVISSNSRKQDVFKALELGALDFVAKPEGAPDLSPIAPELLSKIATVRALRLRLENVGRPAEHAAPEPARAPAPPSPRAAPAPVSSARTRLVVVGASTGGPSALARLVAALPGDLPLAVAIAQHMPEKFTRAFAERLDRSTALEVREAADGDGLWPGRILVAPGGRHLAIVRAPGARGGLRAVVQEPRPGDDRYRPSVDVLFQSAAAACGRDVCGVVLTGMGSDGRAGISAVKQAGGATVAEAESTAVVFGMPKEAADTGDVDEVLPLDRIVDRLVRFAGGR